MKIPLLRAHAKLGWTPRMSFRDLVRMMVEHDLRLAMGERLLVENGHAANLRRNIRVA